MADVQPFRAFRFDTTRAEIGLSNLMAPPYDVLNQRDKQILLDRSPNNIVAIDLPHLPPKTLGPQTAYDQAAKSLATQIERGLIRQDDKPALYAYHQVFDLDGESVTRKMFVARVRLESFDAGIILPHEKTFGGPKEDRLALMKATKCNLSPLLGLYRDEANAIGKALDDATSHEPTAAGDLDGVENKLWAITDSALTEFIAKQMAPKAVYIADGHHRYSTSLMYRDWAKDQNDGSWPNDHPANFVMFVLASMDDPGCVILPYHRAIADMALNNLVAAWSEGTELCAKDQADIVLVDGAGQEAPLTFTNRQALQAAVSDECEPWYQLDYAYLHRYLIDQLLTANLGTEPKIRYVKSAADAKHIARNESGVTLLMNATPLSHLQAVSEAGGLMPQKSTYFYPKLATGMTINPLTDTSPK